MGFVVWCKYGFVFPLSVCVSLHNLSDPPEALQACLSANQRYSKIGDDAENSVTFVHVYYVT